VFIIESKAWISRKIEQAPMRMQQHPEYNAGAGGFGSSGEEKPKKTARELKI